MAETYTRQLPIVDPLKPLSNEGMSLEEWLAPMVNSAPPTNRWGRTSGTIASLPPPDILTDPPPPAFPDPTHQDSFWGGTTTPPATTPPATTPPATTAPAPTATPKLSDFRFGSPPVWFGGGTPTPTPQGSFWGGTTTPPATTPPATTPPATTPPATTPPATTLQAGLPTPGEATMQQAYDIMSPLAQRAMERNLADIRERYGAQGLGFGTDVMRAEMDARRQTEENLLASSMGMGYQYANLPIEQAMMLNQLGTMMAQPAQQAQQMQYQDWMRQAAPLNPLAWLSPQAFQSSTGTPQSYYQPGGMDYLMSFLPFLAMI